MSALTPSVAPMKVRFPECLPLRGPWYLRVSGAVAPSVPLACPARDLSRASTENHTTPDDHNSLRDSARSVNRD